MSMLDDLKRLRRQWRTQATRLTKASKDDLSSGQHRDRCWYESTIYDMNANEIDRVIRAAEKAEAKPAKDGQL